MNLYFFNWPSNVGGADTKMVHLLRLLHRDYEITMVPNREEQFEQQRWREFLDSLEVRYCRYENLPERLEGWAVSLCNVKFFEEGKAVEMRRRGLKVAWSSEMMWHHDGELGYMLLRWVDKVLYVSPVQRAALEGGYATALGNPAAFAGGGYVVRPEDAAVSGEIASRPGRPGLRWVMTGNFVDPNAFPFRDRAAERKPGQPLVIGRLSRPDPDKFPEDFPAFYEGLGVEPARFRVMAWSEQLRERWKDHAFDDRWDLLPQETEAQVPFLHSLDLFVYELGGRFSESWGRAVVEAMLTGAVPIVPADRRHHLHHLITHGESGFLCETRADFARWTQLLANDTALRDRMSLAARAHAVGKLCDPDEHRRLWRLVFEE